jgi:hypothetical protein
MRNGASWAFAKIGGLGRFMVHDLTQGALKSLVLPAIFQADDEGSIPFTRSNVFNHLGTPVLKVLTTQPVKSLDAMFCRLQPEPFCSAFPGGYGACASSTRLTRAPGLS